MFKVINESNINSVSGKPVGYKFVRAVSWAKDYWLSSSMCLQRRPCWLIQTQPASFAPTLLITTCMLPSTGTVSFTLVASTPIKAEERMMVSSHGSSLQRASRTRTWYSGSTSALLTSRGWRTSRKIGVMSRCER